MVSDTSASDCCYRSRLTIYRLPARSAESRLVLQVDRWISVGVESRRVQAGVGLSLRYGVCWKYHLLRTAELSRDASWEAPSLTDDDQRASRRDWTSPRDTASIDVNSRSLSIKALRLSSFCTMECKKYVGHRHEDRNCGRLLIKLFARRLCRDARTVLLSHNLLNHPPLPPLAPFSLFCLRRLTT